MHCLYLLIKIDELLKILTNVVGKSVLDDEMLRDYQELYVKTQKHVVCLKLTLNMGPHR